MTEEERLFDPGPRLEKPVEELPPPEPKFRVQVEVQTDIRFDLKHFFRDALDDYLKFRLPKGHESWEKPMVYLHDWISDQTDVIYIATSPSVRQGFDDIDIDFDRFTEQDARELHRFLGLNDEGTEKL